MSLYFRKKLAASAIILLLVFSIAQAQILSGYIGSTSADDGFKGDIRKITVTKKQFDSYGIKPVSESLAEFIYSSKGQRIAAHTSDRNINYTYGNGFFIITAENRISAKAAFNSDGTLKSYESYNNTGKLIRRDLYEYKDGKITSMERTDGQGRIISKWIYTKDPDGNTLVTNEAGTSSYTYNPDGVLIREYLATDSLNSSEKIYDENGYESSYKMFSFPSADTTMPRDIPTTDITYATDFHKDKDGKTTDLTTSTLIKLNDKWYDADGNFVSSEERRNGRICLTWISYRYDGLLAEVQTEYWVPPTESNRTGYTSLAEEYFYNNDNELTQIITYDEAGNEVERIIYRYDDDGILSMTETYYEPKTQVSYVWTSDGKLSSKLTHSLQEDMFIASIEEYSYDKNGEISELFQTTIQKNSSDGDIGSTVQFSSRKESRYFYKDGILTKKETISRDKKETEFYDYDESGRIILAATHSEFPDGTMTYSEKAYGYEEDEDFTKVSEYDSLRTKKLYTYNKSGNITEIKEFEIRYIDGEYKDILTSITGYAYN